MYFIYRNYPIPDAPSDAEWCDAIAKGKSLFNAFFMSPQEAGQLYTPQRPSATTEWELKDALDWGWKIGYELPPRNRNLGAPGLPQSTYGIARALNLLGKSARDRQDGGSMQMVDVIHFNPYDRRPIVEQTYRFGGDRAPAGARELRYTGSVHTFGYNTREGVIVNLNVKSALHAAREQNPPVPDADLPLLRSLSEIQWVTWEDSAKQEGGIDSLEWYFISSIMNEETRKLIRGALILAGGNVERPMEPWPGVWIAGTTFSGLALLGSPLGKVLGYFLTEHKPSLGGNKWVDGVVIFHGDTPHRAPCLAFHIANAAPRPILAGEPDPSNNNMPHYPSEADVIPDIPDPRHRDWFY